MCELPSNTSHSRLGPVADSLILVVAYLGTMYLGLHSFM